MILGVATRTAGRLITVEGLDGAGKTTLVAGLARELAARGARAAVLREPGGVELSERIRELVKDPALAVDPRAEALLYAAARAQLVAEQLRAAARERASGCCSTASSTPRSPTRAPAAGWASRRSARSTRFATGGLRPDRTLLLRIDPAVGRERIGGRDPDRLEREAAAFFEAVGRAPTTSWPPPSPSASR